jgi:hypothetical protein
MKTRTILLALFMLGFSCSLFSQSVLDNILSPSRLPYLKDSKLIQVSSHDVAGGNSDFITIADGKSATLAEMEGPGVVVQIWVTISSSDKYFLRRILLRMYWDGEENPSVEVPIGDFFGTGFQYKQYVTPFVGMSSGGYYCYWPMPFQRSARIEVVNQTGQTINAFYYHVDYQKLSRPLESTVAYFHANWRRDIRTKSKENYTILEARGEGQVVGVNMSMQSYDGELGYLEGDEMVYVDGEKEPSLYGTGTEDYFTSGWYFNRGEFAAPYHGLILKDDSLGRIAAYRFHILDAIPFSQSVLFTIEHGHANQEIADYSSTAYWYQKEPHKKFAPMLPPGLRIPLRVTVPNGAVEAESLQPTNTTLTSRVEDMSALGPDWSDLKQLKVVAQKGGDAFTLSVPASEDRYDVSLYSTQGPEYGNADVLYDGKKVGEIKGYSSTTMPAGRVLFKDLKARGKELPIQFVVSGKDERSSGYAVGLDAFALEPHRTYIPEWYLIGPFPNPRDANQNRLGLDFAYPPEKEIDLQESYPGDGKKNVSWKLQTTPAGGFVDLSSFDPYELVVAYAVTYVYSPKDQTLPLMLGSDDGVKVLLNDKEAFRLLVLRGAQPDQNSIPLALKQGWNKLMLKIENNYGGFGFYARIPDLDNSLTFSTTKQK